MTPTAAAPSQDINTILASLKLMGVKVHVHTYHETTEVFTVPPDSDDPDGGMKFTFKDDVLVGLHARALADDCDNWWTVVPDTRPRA